MFGFFKNKAYKVIATNTLQELVMCKLYNNPFEGRGAEEISQKTGLNLVSTYGMLNRMIEYHLIEEIEWNDKLFYRAINIPCSLDVFSNQNQIFGYAKRSIDRVNFSCQSGLNTQKQHSNKEKLDAMPQELREEFLRLYTNTLFGGWVDRHLYKKFCKKHGLYCSK
ncbi:hypothetical protein [Vibrio sp. ER1A]|uniref:hypothetical protein n=1 Tax=Vibrio sp. ER1A TaxID=1517681 RepID=UPI00069016BF|nr:hypothetical protein [Vibrio sp. ER1A]